HRSEVDSVPRARRRQAAASATSAPARSPEMRASPRARTTPSAARSANDTILSSERAWGGGMSASDAPSAARTAGSMASGSASIARLHGLLLRRLRALRPRLPKKGRRRERDPAADDDRADEGDGRAVAALSRQSDERACDDAELDADEPSPRIPACEENREAASEEEERPDKRALAVRHGASTSRPSAPRSRASSSRGAIQRSPRSTIHGATPSSSFASFTPAGESSSSLRRRTATLA